MPFLKIQTNQILSQVDACSLASRSSRMVADLLGKPEAYVMVSVETATAMLFAGTEEPLAYLELKSIGLPKSITASAARALCDLVAAQTGVAASRIYIEFTDAPRDMWGWNGDTF
jgi:phenylpyruvate tautomerase PptA (4-oxalocrotonate tautomerase family)